MLHSLPGDTGDVSEIDEFQDLCYVGFGQYGFIFSSGYPFQAKSKEDHILVSFFWGVKSFFDAHSRICRHLLLYWGRHDVHTSPKLPLEHGVRHNLHVVGLDKGNATLLAVGQDQWDPILGLTGIGMFTGGTGF